MLNCKGKLSSGTKVPRRVPLWLAAPVALLGSLFLLIQPARADLMVGGTVFAKKLEEFIQLRVEAAVEGQLEENVEEDVQNEIENDIDQIIEDSIESSIEDSIAANVEGAAEEGIEAAVEESVAQSVEEAVTSGVEESVEASVEDSVADNLEQALAENVEASVEDSVQESVEESVAQNLEESVEEQVADGIEDSVEEQVADSVEESVEEQVASSVEDTLERDLESEVADVIEDRLEGKIDAILERIENELEVDERRIHKDQWLVMAEPEVFEQLAEEGYLFDRVTDLPGMGLRLAEVAAPSSFDISKVRQGVVDVVGSDRAEVDLNHFYTAGSPTTGGAEDGVDPRNAIVFPTDIDAMDLRIGMIDSQVDTTHPALNQADIRTRSFAPDGASLPSFHGTAIASIIAARGDDYRGLAPSAEVYAAAVFERDRKRGDIASTVSLVRALDWLIASGVDVVNLSLAGPPNRLLEAALRRASERQVMVLAAAGNGGPVAEPMYPAAYDSVVAVTAVDAGGKVYRLANRGSYLDLAAPGVAVRHARAGGGYAASSGTSFAVPFAAAAAARLRQVQPGVNALDALQQAAQDLGPPGRDEIYGYGLLRPGV